MQILALETARISTPTALALGYFDAFHLGHKRLLKSVQSSAFVPAMFTFSGDFYTALGYGDKPLYTFAERMRMAAESGMRYVLTLPADDAHFALSADAFLALLSNAHPALIVCGEDFRFGAGARAGVEELRAFCHQNGIQLKVVPILLDDSGAKVGTKSIRQAVTEGDMPRANALLGRYYAIEGEVVHGRADGAKLGFPTANFALDSNLAAPATGVYACYAVCDGTCYAAVCNVGAHPTLGDDSVNVEAYLMGFDGNLYGKRITLQFVRRLRDVVAFASVDALKQQIAADALCACRILGGTND